MKKSQQATLFQSWGQKNKDDNKSKGKEYCYFILFISV